MRVKFTKFGANTATGSFAPGDIAEVSDALAKHFVEDAGVAGYSEPPPTPAKAKEPVKTAAAKAK